jgi:hypothetical protein
MTKNIFLPISRSKVGQLDGFAQSLAAPGSPPSNMQSIFALKLDRLDGFRAFIKFNFT